MGKLNLCPIKNKKMNLLHEISKKAKYKNKKQRYQTFYGLEVLHILLEKDGYKLVSFCENSIPTNGSKTFAIEKTNPKHNYEVEKVIVHKNLDITIKTKNKGFVKYIF